MGTAVTTEHRWRTRHQRTQPIPIMLMAILMAVTPITRIIAVTPIMGIPIGIAGIGRSILHSFSLFMTTTTISTMDIRTMATLTTATSTMDIALLSMDITGIGQDIAGLGRRQLRAVQSPVARSPAALHFQHVPPCPQSAAPEPAGLLCAQQRLTA